MKIHWTYKLDEMAIHMTQHATDRAEHRDGSSFKISKKTIEDVVNSAEDKIINFGQQYKTLILKTQNAINIVGSLSKKAGEWIFDIITVMVKPNFHSSRPDDKVIFINEMKKIKEKEIPKLISIIESIEKKRIGKSTIFEQFKIGSKVKFHEELGTVITISPHRTSLIVEFQNHKKISFSLNKRAKNITVDNLSLHKLLEETK